MHDDELRDLVRLVEQVPVEPDAVFVDRLRRDISLAMAEASGAIEDHETHRHDSIQQLAAPAEHDTATVDERRRDGSHDPSRGLGPQWLVPVTEGDPMTGRTLPWWPLLGAAAALLMATGLGALLLAGGDGDAINDSAVSTTGEATEDESPERLTALEVVENRYEAINELDLEAIDTNVSDDVVYCHLALEVVQQFEGCLDSSVEYFGPNGHAERVEIMALRVHAYGGEIEYRCDEDGATVTCSQRESHLLLDVAGTEYVFTSYTYEVSDGQIVYIEVEELGPEGLISSQVRTQEFAYANWIETTHPDDFDDLTAAGRPAPTNETASRHRELVTEWVASLGT